MSGKSTPPPSNLPSSKTNYPKRHAASTEAQNDHPRRLPGTEPHQQQETHSDQLPRDRYDIDLDKGPDADGHPVD